MRGPEQAESAVERRFRKSFSRLDRLATTENSHSDYLRKGLRPNCIGTMDISPLLKVICTLRQLSYCSPTQVSDDLFDVSETTTALFLEHFCAAVKRALG